MSWFLAILLAWSVPYDTSQAQFTINSERGKAIEDTCHFKATRSSSTMNMGTCFEQCLRKCMCNSFQICKNTDCNISWVTKSMNKSSVYDRDDCVYYEFQSKPPKEENGQCTASGCRQSINCCLTSSPCVNGGTCGPPDPAETTKRFSCQCVDGYHGGHCQFQAKSCAAYADGPRKPGNYKIFDDGNNTYEVFCDFVSASRAAWTLLMSYQLSFKDDLENLVYDQKYDEDTPNWYKYRLRKARMLAIQNDTKKWRITCQYENKQSAASTDEIIGSNHRVNILDRLIGCTDVDKIKLGHTKRFACQVFMTQQSAMLHFHSGDYIGGSQRTKCNF